MKLALGTVQFGLKYGITNSSGQISFDDATSIINYARQQGVKTLDTAAAYGASQKVLGQIGIQGFDTVTKVAPLIGTDKDVKTQIAESIADSLRELQLDSLYCVLLHQSADLSGAAGSHALETLTELRERGCVQKIGVSIYSPEELDACRFVTKLDLIQAPYNVFDQRLRTSGWLAKLKALGIEIHTRSVFLQGVLLAKPGNRPRYFDQFSTCFNKWDNWVGRSGLSPLAASLGPIVREALIDRVVVGIDSTIQLRQIIGEMGAAIAPHPSPDFSCSIENLIDPRRWRKS